MLSKPKKSVLEELYQAVLSGDAEKARRQAEAIVKTELSNEALEKMKKALAAADAKFMRKEYLSADVAASFDAMQAAFKILEPHLKVKPAGFGAKVVIGTLKGNLQGLGKDIVAAALRSAGFQVVDVGVDVSPEAFVSAIEKEKSQVIAVSVSVVDTLPFLKELVDLLKRKKLRNKVKFIIGGRAVSNTVARKYWIDAYVKDEWDCVKKVTKLLSN
jgi:5-methyltetrahydrofolate--homocysteine methyltransferase